MRYIFQQLENVWKRFRTVCVYWWKNNFFGTFEREWRGGMHILSLSRTDPFFIFIACKKKNHAKKNHHEFFDWVTPLFPRVPPLKPLPPTLYTGRELAGEKCSYNSGIFGVINARAAIRGNAMSRVGNSIRPIRRSSFSNLALFLGQRTKITSKILHYASNF